MLETTSTRDGARKITGWAEGQTQARIIWRNLDDSWQGHRLVIVARTEPLALYWLDVGVPYPHMELVSADLERWTDPVNDEPGCHCPICEQVQRLEDRLNNPQDGTPEGPVTVSPPPQIALCSICNRAYDLAVFWQHQCNPPAPNPTPHLAHPHLIQRLREEGRF